MKRQLARAQATALLSRCCRQLLLQPDHTDARDVLAFALATVPLTLCESDPLLMTALVKEARAHAEELAYRLEAPGYSSLYIAAATAKLHQTLSLLQLQLPPEAEVTHGEQAAA